MAKRLVFASLFGVVALVFALWLRGIAPAHFSLPTPKPPSGPNAFDDFARAASLARDDDKVSSVVTSPPTASPLFFPGDVTKAQARQVVADNVPAMNALYDGFMHPYFATPLRPAAQLMPYLSNDRKLARLCAFEAREAAQRGDWTQSQQLSLDAIELGNNISQHGVLINNLVGIACDAIGRRTAYLSLGRLDATTAEQAARRLERLNKTMETPPEALTEEKWFGEAAVNQFLGSASGSREMASFLSDSGTFKGSTLNLAIAETYINLLWIRYPKKTIARNYERYMNAVIRKASLPYYNANRAPATPMPNDPINSILLPNFEAFHFTETRDQAFNVLLMTRLALRAYTLEHDSHFPAKLDSLVPKYLAYTPIDPFANANVSLQYHLSRDKVHYLLYSVGPDGIDNGGAPIIYKPSPGMAKRAALKAFNTGDVIAGKDDQ